MHAVAAVGQAVVFSRVIRAAAQRACCALAILALALPASPSSIQSPFITHFASAPRARHSLHHTPHARRGLICLLRACELCSHRCLVHLFKPLASRSLEVERSLKPPPDSFKPPSLVQVAARSSRRSLQAAVLKQPVIQASGHSSRGNSSRRRSC